MASPQTLPLSVPHAGSTVHEHAWITESRHPTSDGVVIYVRCASCPARRVDVHAAAPAPAALSRIVGRTL